MIIIIIPLRFFHTSISWWFSSGVWVTASLLQSPQFSRTLLIIQGNLKNAVVWMVSTYPPISKSSSPIINT